VENYNQQHQDLRTENGVVYGDTIDKMDFNYLEKVAKLNIAALVAMASAPPPPEPKAEGAVSTDTTVTWQAVPGAASYVVRWRRTDANQWQAARRVAETGVVITDCRVPGPQCEAAMRQVGMRKVVLPHIRVDDWVFGVSSVGANGFESAVASAVPGGAFKPYVPPPPKPQQ
jgi:hypothetical protein